MRPPRLHAPGGLGLGCRGFLGRGSVGSVRHWREGRGTLARRTRRPLPDAARVRRVQSAGSRTVAFSGPAAQPAARRRLQAARTRSSRTGSLRPADPPGVARVNTIVNGEARWSSQMMAVTVARVHVKRSVFRQRNGKYGSASCERQTALSYRRARFRSQRADAPVPAWVCGTLSAARFPPCSGPSGKVAGAPAAPPGSTQVRGALSSSPNTMRPWTTYTHRAKMPSDHHG